jgi:hypothetical protein
MKIYVTKDDSKIENFTNIKLQNLTQDIPDIVNNSCEDIVLNDVIDFIPYSEIGNLLKLIVSKLRMKGRLIITGTELGLISRGVISGDISSEQYSLHMAGRLSSNFMHIIVDVLSKLNLKTELASTKGIIYEIIATR